MCLEDGVTGWVDAGSGGADTWITVAAVCRGAPQDRPRAHQYCAHRRRPGRRIARSQPCHVDLRAARLRANRDVVIGVKGALSADVGAPNDLEHCGAAGGGRRSAVMIHVGQNYSPLRSLPWAAPSAGDIVTHITRQTQRPHR